MLVLQLAAAVAAIVALTCWRRRRRLLAHIEQRFVAAVLAGDYQGADREAAAWFTAVAPRSRLFPAPPNNRSGRHTPPRAAGDSGLSAA